MGARIYSRPVASEADVTATCQPAVGLVQLRLLTRPEIAWLPSAGASDFSSLFIHPGAASGLWYGED